VQAQLGLKTKIPGAFTPGILTCSGGSAKKCLFAQYFIFTIIFIENAIIWAF
jgi:hypothetical protein